VPLREPGRVETQAQGHPADWWAQFLEVATFDPAYFVEGLADLVERTITAPLLRREARIAADVVVRHLNRPASAELTERATAAAARLATTLRRLDDRSTGGTSTAEAAALSLAAARTEPAGIPSRSAASPATSWIVSPSGTVSRRVAVLPSASIPRTAQVEIPGGNS
jgi:hypothetical protein